MFEQIKSIFVETLNLEENDITLESLVKDDLGIDSMDAIELVMELEDIFGLKIKESEVNAFITVKDIVDFIVLKKG